LGGKKRVCESSNEKHITLLSQGNLRFFGGSGISVFPVPGIVSASGRKDEGFSKKIGRGKLQPERSAGKSLDQKRRKEV